MVVKGYNLREDTILEIGKFTILWNWFENFWCDNNCNPRKIKEISNRIIINNEKLSYFAAVLNERRHWFNQLEMDYVRESLHPDNSRISNEDDMRIMCQFIEQSGDDVICGCLLVLCRIRNNMMHGMKQLVELDDQIGLFQAANAVLESIGESRESI